MFKSFFLSLLLTGSLFALTNYEVALKSEAATSGFKDAVSNMQMTLINARGQKKVRTMKMKVLEGKDEDKSLMEFLSPADVKGTKFLSYEHIDKDDDQWMYLPALKRIKRISSKNKSGAFMGSEFSYEDLSAFNVKKYTYEDKLEEVTLDGVAMYKGLSIPISKYTGYTKLITWIDKKTFLIKKIEYYDRKKKLLKTAYFEDYKDYGDLYRMGKITMKNIQNDKTTILVWSDEKIKTGLKDKDFHKRYLKR